MKSPTLVWAPIALAAIVFAVDLAIPMGMAVWLPYLALVVLSARAHRPRFLLVFSAACAGLLLLGFFIDFGPPNIEPRIGLVNRMLGMIVIGVSAYLCWLQLRTEASLEIQVQERTAELAQANAGLQAEIAERKRAEQEREKVILQLQEALAKITALQGVLPVCRICQKIRDDKGAWHVIDKYLRAHSEAKVLHSVCPECAKNPKLP
jgi:hypothetical protein